jgi:hypothetical protein
MNSAVDRYHTMAGERARSAIAATRPHRFFHSF